MTDMNAAARIAELEATLRDVLGHIQPEGHPSWRVNGASLISNDELRAWWQVLGVTPTWEEKD